MFLNADRRHLRIAATVLFVVCVATGTASAQVYMVEDINPGPGGTYIFRAGALGYAVYFSAYDGVHGEELWVSDGTAQGTYLVANIWPETTPDGTGAFSSKPDLFIAASGGMYFGASHQEDPVHAPDHDYGLWRSNGYPGNASRVWDVEPALGVLSIADAAVMNGDLYIAGWDETYGIELWRVSGATATRLTDIEPGVGGSRPGQFAVLGSKLLFAAEDSETYGPELWVTDGTYGDETVIDIVEGPDGSGASGLTVFGGKVYFSAWTAEHGAEPWVSYGSEFGTGRLADLNPGPASSDPCCFVPAGDLLFFLASDDINGRRLWVTNGTAGGTHAIDGLTSAALFGITEAVAYDDRLFFPGTDDANGTELWVSDGTTEGTGIFKDINTGTYLVGEPPDEEERGYSSGPAELTVAGGFLFFNADDGVHGPSLWVSDGTQTGTFMVANLFDYWTEEGPKGLTATTDRLFFQTESAGSNQYGREVHAIRTLNVVKPPAAPTGEGSGSTESTYTYSTSGGSISLAGGDVQYRFSWGDGESTDWLDVGVTSADHAWAEAGTYEVTVDARSVDTPSVVSNSSDALSVLMSFTESVEVSFTSAPQTGEIWIEYEFALGGSSDYGHDLEYRVDWGDGESSEWAPFNPDTGESIVHDWDELGNWPVTVTLRCAEHTDVTDSAEHWISIEEEILDTPAVDGPTTGWTDESYDFTVTGGSSAGHDLQYIIFWGDGSDTGWQDFGEDQTSAVVSHTWTVAEPFTVEVGVRCATHDYLEAWSSDHSIEITAPPDEELTGPDLQHVGGDWNGYPDVSYSFTLSASSNLDHGLEYRVNWDGDMVFSEWTAFGEGVTSVQLSHTWTSAADWDINIEVRCIEHSDVSSSGTWQMFINPEEVSDHSLVGPDSGIAGVSYPYTLTAHTTSGHAMQYQIYWGHGDGPGPEDWFDLDPATGTAQLSHAWPVDGVDRVYQVDYGVRCKDHPSVQEWASIDVSIPGETIVDHTLVGPTEGLVGVDLEFTVAGTSSEGHALEYKYDWGDGFPTEWAALTGGSATQSYAWAYPGEFTVTASVRCATHNHVLSERQQVVTITSDTPPGWIFGDDFEYGDTEDWSATVGLAP